METTISKRALWVASTVLLCVIVGSWAALHPSMPRNVYMWGPFAAWFAVIMMFTMFAMMVWRYYRRHYAPKIGSTFEPCTMYYEWEGRCIGYHHHDVLYWTRTPANYNLSDV